MAVFSLLIALLICSAVLIHATDYPTPGVTFAAKDYTTWNKRSVMKSKRADIHIDFTAEDGSPDYIHLYRLDMVGTPYERGYAQGYLLSKEIIEFLEIKINQFYRSAILDLDISQYPEPLQDILRIIQIKGAIAAPEALKKAMTWVWEREQSYFPAYVFEEIDGMAKGICDSIYPLKCDVDAWKAELQAFNMMPELIRMACTAYGAWGNATPSGKGLIQTRALDFGSGPWSNYTIIGTHRDDTNPDFNAFVSVTFPGMVGAITGVSQRGIGISEKVWMTYDEKNLQPGSFQGEADIFVLRDILQNSKSKADAEAYLKSIPRTWAIWIGVGDYESMTFDLVGYRQTEAIAYDDVTMPSMTGQPYIEHVAYVDKHPQVSRSFGNSAVEILNHLLNLFPFLTANSRWTKWHLTNCLEGLLGQYYP